MLALLLSAFAVGALLFLARPSPIDPAAFEAPPPLALEGVLTPNGMLASTELVGVGDFRGPEDVEFDPLGRMVTGVESGDLLRGSVSSAGGGLIPFADTGGRPLGLDFDSEGLLWIADSEKGLVSVDRAGLVSLHTQVRGELTINFANDVVAGTSDGRVYFSDSSTRWGPREIALEALEARGHGRLLEFDPTADRITVLLDGLYFANGVAVSSDERFVLVAESFRYRIRRYWLTGPRKGEDEIFVEHLPGYPDGISLTDRGTFWVAIYDLRSRMLDRQVHPRPWLKRLIARLPRTLLSERPSYGLLVELDQTGAILRSFHDVDGMTARGITAVVEHEGVLFFAMLRRNAIGRLPLSSSE